jgi:hypothetical protein
MVDGEVRAAGRVAFCILSYAEYLLYTILILPPLLGKGCIAATTSVMVNESPLPVTHTNDKPRNPLLIGLLAGLHCAYP